MSFHLITQFGSTETNPTTDRMREVLSSIDPQDSEHPDVSLTHESEWCLSVFASGLVIFENLEAGEPRHQRLASPELALPLWEQLSRGDLAALEQYMWQPGYEME